MKKITIKVYRPSGEFIKEWTNIVFNGFTKEINSGLGECIITMGEKFDYQGGELEIGNTVEVFVSDDQTLTDGFLKIYSGYISLIEPEVNGGEEGITIHILGHYTKLSTDILKNGSQVVLYSDSAAGLTTTASGSATDIGLILRGIIDRYRAETTNPKLNYSNITIPLISQTALYSISLKTYRDAFDSVCSMLPTGYFWYVDEDGQIWIKQAPTTPTHTFELSKHNKSIKAQKSMEAIRNFLLIWNGETGVGTKFFKSYSDAGSLAQYGRRAETLVDYGIDVSDTASADAIAAKFLAENKDPQIKLTCEIVDNNESNNGYDIESIQPGDTCRFVGFNPDLADFIKDNMLITKVQYLVDRVIIDVEPTKSGLVDWQKKTSLKVEDLASYNVPATYT